MTGYDESAGARIKRWDAAQDKEIRINVYLSGIPEDAGFKYLADQFGKLTRHLEMNLTDQPPSGGRTQKRPAVFLNDRIIYSALPYDKELPPFLEALTSLDNPPDLPSGIRSDLDQVAVDVSLRLYIAQACPHCPEVVRTVVGLALNCRRILLEIIDGTLFDEAARVDGVMSAPCLILDNDFRWTGSVTAEEICRMILHRDLSGLSTESLRTILEEGRASWIAEKMMLQNRIFEGFTGLLLHEVWSVRLGAMVVVEELAEQDPRLALTLCPLLLDAFAGRDAGSQGDILYALGAAGNLDTLEKIRELMPTLTDEEVIEAAEEAIAAIEDRQLYTKHRS